MAAPATKTIKDLNGSWTLNDTLSDSSVPALSLQGIGYVTRTAISYATITLVIKQYEDKPKAPSEATDIVTHIDILQSASKLSSTSEARCLDDFERTHTDWLFGTVTGRSQWASLDDIDDEFLKKGWEIEGEGKTLILNSAENKEKGWLARQVWGFQIVNGERRYCRNIVVTKGKERAQIRLVYNYNPPAN